MNNPWLNMSNSSRRRVDYEIPVNIFWIKDEAGRFGLYIVSSEKFDKGINYQLKGIDVYKKLTDVQTEIVLLLKNIKDWEIFLTLCKDLIAASALKSTEKDIIEEIFKRLNQWKRILSENGPKIFPLHLEMGLLGELLCLTENIAPLSGINKAVESWTGPDFEKQDFIMDGKTVEVKTYSPSNGKTVRISSAEQLYASGEYPLYLNAVGLQKSEKGIDLEFIIDKILNNESLTSGNISLMELKLINYGYFRELYKETNNKFFVSENEIYSITEGFPRIRPENIAPEISNVAYSIDLWSCKGFIVKNI